MTTAVDCDVACVLNVQSDHLGLRGIDTLDELAEVKRTVVEIANSRWDTDSLACYRIGDGQADVINLLTLVEPAVRARLPAARRDSYSLRVRSDLPVKFDSKGRLRFLVALFVPKAEDGLAFRVDMAVGTAAGRLTARVVSVQRAKIDPRL